MARKVVLFLFAFLAFVSFRKGNHGPSSGQVGQLYHRADSLFHLYNRNAATDSVAIAVFGTIIHQLENKENSDKDSLLFQCYLKKGILLDLNRDYAAAKENYLNASTIKGLGDSVNFMVNVYTGTCYYNLNNFDSANYFLLKAESLTGHSVSGDDQVLLYNTLGALYYDNGNYLQSKNYFSEALEIIQGRDPVDTISIVSIETNMATSFYRLGLYRESLAMYSRILKYHVFGNYIYMNMGRTLTALNKYKEALDCFRKVDANKVPGVCNEIAYTQLQLLRPDSAAHFLDRLQRYRGNDALNTLDLGINASYRADLLISEKKFMEALSSLQNAIIIFSGGFNNQDIYANPANFTGAFAYYRLFFALARKADVLSSLYRQTSKQEYLLASLATYQSVLSLLDYIEKSYDTDDAKILLKKKSSGVYQKALSVCLSLYAINHKSDYLGQAFLISEKDRASIIAANLKEKTFTNIPGIEEKLLEKERNIKYNIARLDVESDQVQDNKIIASLASEKARYETELTVLQKSLEKNEHYYQLKYNDSCPDIPTLQECLTPDQALISFYATKDALHVFAITHSSFGYKRIDSLKLIQQDVAAWLNALKTTESGRKFKGGKTASELYTNLVSPMQSLVPGKNEWIIIPDGILYYLPFESLPSGNTGEGTLLETTAISYQFSSRFITRPSTEHTNIDSYRVLAFAPFVHEGTTYTEPKPITLEPLPASGEEIDGLGGKQYIDSAATKENFLRNINRYPIVHLATHAISDMNNSAGSFIAFYPEKKSIKEDCLFLEELYGLNMDSTQLVIISACETGKGELVNNEGVISIARAFMYAGCSSAINSLWKADDRATSAILKQFHIYLQQGYSKSKALQRAKLDYIRGNALYKSPNYWAHLILIGNVEPVCYENPGSNWWMILATLAIVLSALVVIKKSSVKKKST